MSHKVTIGTHEDGKAFTLPADVVTSTLIVYGGKGMGKTNFGSVLVEEMSHAGLHWCALDPMGVWWGLRHSADGKGPGIECLILGGTHGDIPIEPTGGAIVADLVVDEDANVIVDFSRKANGEAWSVGEKVRFVRDFGRQLHRRQSSLIDGKRREPICVVMDEAARFIPQVIFKTEKENPQAECLSVWSAIAEEGRNFGIGVVFLTQRSARLNKSVAELADVMVAFRTIGPNSVGAIIDWLGEHKLKKEVAPFAELLRSLRKGDALFISPGWLEFEGLVHVRLRETFDSSATPKPGERTRKVTGKAAKPDLAAYAERMRETIERARENDPTELKRTVAQLRKEVAQAQKAKPAAPAAKVDPEREQRTLERVVGKELKSRDAHWDAVVRAYQKMVRDQIKFALDNLGEALKGLPEFIPPIKTASQTVIDVAPPTPARATHKSPPTQPRRVQTTAPNNGGGGEVTNVEQKIIDQLAELQALGIEQPDKTQVGLMCGYSNTRSGGFSGPLKRLLDKGLIWYPGSGRVALTDDGRAAANPTETPLTTDELQQWLMQKLGGPEAKILERVIAAYPDSLNKDELGATLGYTNTRSGGFSGPLKRLRDLGLISYPERGSVAATPVLFLEHAA